jgi:hypothetical protein
MLVKQEIRASDFKKSEFRESSDGLFKELFSKVKQQAFRFIIQ